MAVTRGFTQQRQPKVFGLVVGVSKYNDHHFDSLRYAASDAMLFYEFLKKNFAGQFDTISSILANTPLAIKDSIKHFIVLFSDIAENTISGDKIFIYWSGHGVLNGGDQKLICTDTKDIGAGDSFSGGVNLSLLRGALKEAAIKKGVKVYIIIDACRKATAESGDENEQRTNRVMQTMTANDASPDGEIYMYSTSPNFNSNELGQASPIKAGLFSYFLLLGLQGGAADKGKNFVTYTNLVNFLHTTVGPYSRKYKIAVQDPELKTANDNDRITTLPMNLATRNKDYGDSLLRSIFDNTPILTQTARQDTVQQLTNALMRIDTIFNTAPVMMVAAVTANDIISVKSRYSYKSGRKSGNGDRLQIMATTASRRQNIFLLDGDKMGDKMVASDTKSFQQEDIWRQLPGNISNDSAAGILYDSLVVRINKDQLVEPAGKAAIDSYDTLNTFYFMDDYLSGKIIDSKMHDFEVAQKEIAATMKLDSASRKSASDSARLNFFHARALSASKNPNDWNKGFKLIEHSLKRDSTAAYMYHTLGVLYQNKGRFYTALSYFDTALHFAPDWLYPKYNMATTYFELQEFDKSINTFLSIANKDSNYSRVYSWIAYNYETMTNNREYSYLKAISYNRKALQLDSTNTYAYLNLGRIYLNMANARSGNQVAQILDSAKYFLNIGSFKYNNSQCLAVLGKLHTRTQNIDAAEYCFNEALHQNFFDTSALKAYTSYLLDYKKDTIKAEKLFLKILDSTHYDYKFYLPFKSFVFNTKSPYAGDSIFREIIKTNNEDPSIFLEHSTQWENLDSLGRAIDVLKLGLSYIPNSTMLNYAISKLYFKQSNLVDETSLNASLTYLKAAYALNPNDSRVDFGLSQVYQVKELTDSAKHYSNKATASNKFIEYTQNFSNDLLSSGSNAFQKGQYQEALKYYHLANALTDNKDTSNNVAPNDRKFMANLNLSKLFYVNNVLDSALAYNKNSKKYITIYNFDDELDSSANLIKQMQLEALINIETKKTTNYKKALHIFNNIDQINASDLNTLQTALCLFILGKGKRAKNLLLFQKDINPQLFLKMVESENGSYSKYFVSELKKFVDYLN